MADSVFAQSTELISEKSGHLDWLNNWLGRDRLLLWAVQIDTQFIHTHSIASRTWQLSLGVPVENQFPNQLQALQAAAQQPGGRRGP